MSNGNGNGNSWLPTILTVLVTAGVLAMSFVVWITADVRSDIKALLQQSATVSEKLKNHESEIDRLWGWVESLIDDPSQMRKTRKAAPEPRGSE